MPVSPGCHRERTSQTAPRPFRRRLKKPLWPPVRPDDAALSTGGFDPSRIPSRRVLFEGQLASMGDESLCSLCCVSHGEAERTPCCPFHPKTRQTVSSVCGLMLRPAIFSEADVRAALPAGFDCAIRASQYCCFAANNARRADERTTGPEVHTPAIRAVSYLHDTNLPSSRMVKRGPGSRSRHVSGLPSLLPTDPASRCAPALTENRGDASGLRRLGYSSFTCPFPALVPLLAHWRPTSSYHGFHAPGYC